MLWCLIYSSSHLLSVTLSSPSLSALDSSSRIPGLIHSLLSLFAPTALLWANAGGLTLAPHLVKLTQRQTATLMEAEREQQRDVQ
ncbi:unnamed protein product [Gadus morhua 'NCC']